jgi:two-component system, NarL family, sensor histidine kinase UhpB
VAVSAGKHPVRPVGQAHARRRSDGEAELSRQLHDGVSQTLNMLLLEMELFKAEQVGREGVLRELDRMQTSIRGVLANVRGILHDVRKDQTSAADLRLALKELAGRLATSAGAIVTVFVAQDWPDDLRAGDVVNVIRIVEEAAHNSVIHAAASAISIELASHEDELSVTVRDDGRGTVSGITSPGLGIRGMRERAGLLGGTLEIKSEIGGGTEIRLLIPWRGRARLPEPLLLAQPATA